MTPTELVASVHALAAQVRTVSLIMNGLMVLLALAVGVTLWRAEQRRIAERRVCDRLAQEADPEGWAQRQARQAQVAALVEEELARMRQARWWRRWWARARTREEDTA